MRVLSLVPCRFWGGPEKQTLRLAVWLKARARVETLFAVMPHESGNIDRNPLLVRARAARLEASPFIQRRRYDLIEGVRLLREQVVRHRPDLVVTMGYKANVIASWLNDVPTMATVRGWTAEDPKVRLFEWLERRTLRRHEAVMVVSKALRDAVIREGVTAERVFWVPNAMDVGELPPARSRSEICGELGIEADRPLLGAVGRLSPEKGHRVLLGAFAELRRTVTGAHLVLVGDGPEESSLRELTRRLSLVEHVSFLGLRPDGQEIIGALDVLALPSFTEGMPNVLLEAFAYGTPVVATAVGGVPDMIASGRSGWLVPPGDPVALSAALREAVADVREREARATSAREALAKNFTVEKQAEAWLHAARAAVSGSLQSAGSGLPLS
jgi:glycosyltransferase involved in cell wall biosynthesis